MMNDNDINWESCIFYKNGEAGLLTLKTVQNFNKSDGMLILLESIFPKTSFLN